MKFSLIYEAQTTVNSRAADRQVFDETLEQVLLAEDVGFDNVWCVEHTALTYYAHMSAPETFLAFIAAKTSRIGIGHGVICLPPMMNHPVKVAERVATLDLLSKGRVHFGVGKGGSQQEAGTFGYELSQVQPMIDEMMYLIPKIFVQDEIEHNGKYVQIPRRPIHPKPYQDPHPPMYMAVTNMDTLVRAGSRGMGALVLGFGGPEDVADKSRVYQEAWDKRRVEDQVGFRPIKHLAALCPTVVLDDSLKARKIGIRGQKYFMEALAYSYSGGPKPDPTVDENDDLGLAYDATGKLVIKTEHGFNAGGGKKVDTQFASEKVSVDFHDPGMMLLNPNHAYGTPDDCINYVSRLIEAGADEILFICQMGTAPQWAQLETIRNIGEHVIPYFRAQGK